MIKVEIAYIKEGPSDDIVDFYNRIVYEGRVYQMLSEFERSGVRIESKGDGREFVGKYYYAVFDTEYEAALFKLTHL